EHTITDPRVLAKEAAAIRKRGYAISLEERVLGIRTVAAPVRDHTGAVVASVSITGPGGRMSRRRLNELGALAARGCAEISTRLGYGGDALEENPGRRA
ncbi:MAG: IclR family transcriptional regulator domain-containing protein, partial [Actinomycetota bacterium]